MTFLSDNLSLSPEKPLFASVLANTMLSVVPGMSGAGPTPEKTLLTPILDAELVLRGKITSMPSRPDTPTGCPTPASITRAMMDMCGIIPLFINAGLAHRPTVPCLDAYGEPGSDPRYGDAVPRAGELFEAGRVIGAFLSRAYDSLVRGESVPGGTTTALCVLRALGYPARVSSSYADNPVGMKEAVWNEVSRRIGDRAPLSPLDTARCCGDPMITLSAGVGKGFGQGLVLAGGTQMLAVAALMKAMSLPLPAIATTVYVRDDPSANFPETAGQIGVPVAYVDPGFGDLGHAGLARYCTGEVKEGMGAGGAMFLAATMGHSPGEIRKKILATVISYQ